MLITLIDRGSQSSSHPQRAPLVLWPKLEGSWRRWPRLTSDGG